MTSRILHYLSQHALATAAFVCSILALAGSSYAAFTISGSQIQNHTINPSKFNTKYINGSVRAWAIVAPNGKVIRGAGGPKVGLQAGDPGGYVIRWRVSVGRCATQATIDPAISPPTAPSSGAVSTAPPLTAGFATAATTRRHNQSAVQTFAAPNQPMPLGFDVAVTC